MTNPTTTPRTEPQVPRCGALAPAFALPDVARPEDAAPVRLRTWRQRRPVLLALLPTAAGDARLAWLRALDARRADLDEAQVVTLAVVEGEREAIHALALQVDTAFPLLADTTGAALAAYLGTGATQPALALVDRYSQLLALLPPTDAGQPDLDAALCEFAFADQADCACGLPVWPEEER